MANGVFLCEGRGDGHCVSPVCDRRKGLDVRIAGSHLEATARRGPAEGIGIVHERPRGLAERPFEVVQEANGDFGHDLPVGVFVLVGNGQQVGGGRLERLGEFAQQSSIKAADPQQLPAGGDVFVQRLLRGVESSADDYQDRHLRNGRQALPLDDADVQRRVGHAALAQGGA